jgi:hypothetical protein
MLPRYHLGCALPLLPLTCSPHGSPSHQVDAPPPPFIPVLPFVLPSNTCIVSFFARNFMERPCRPGAPEQPRQAVLVGREQRIHFLHHIFCKVRDDHIRHKQDQWAGHRQGGIGYDHRDLASGGAHKEGTDMRPADNRGQGSSSSTRQGKGRRCNGGALGTFAREEGRCRGGRQKGCLTRTSDEGRAQQGELRMKVNLSTC